MKIEILAKKVYSKMYQRKNGPS